MNKLLLLLTALLISGCSSLSPADTSEDSGIIQETLLMNEEFYQGSEAVRMRKLLKGNPNYKKEGHFYKVDRKMLVFGSPCKYVGLLGINMIPGPNVTVTGDPQKVAAYIEENHGLTFKRQGNVFVHKMNQHLGIVIIKHPGIAGDTIVIAAYTGP